MNYLAKKFQPLYKELAQKLENEEFLTDRTGCKIVEILAPKVVYDLKEAENGFIDFESRQSPRTYCAKEKQWYDSHELNIDKVSSIKMWNNVCDVDQEINSNYGYLVFSKGNFSQFQHCVETLKAAEDSRQAIIIYTRPSIQLEHNDLGSKDFICTNFQHFFIRNKKLNCVTSMRSNDAIFGAFNDQPWFVEVCKRMLDALKETYPDLELGEMTFIPNSFHCYERHFDVLKEIAAEE